jgi:site-specific recombinase XerD
MSNTTEIENLMQGFRLGCQAEGKSPKTIEWYGGFLKRFRQFLVSRSWCTSVGQIDKTHIREFIPYLQVEARCPRKKTPLSSATVPDYVRTLKAFFSWAKREDYVASNPMEKIPVPKATNKIINTMMQDQIVRLIHQCGEQSFLYIPRLLQKEVFLISII